MFLLGVVLTVVAGAAQASYLDPKCATGGDVIVHLFEWRWDDIAQECEDFLGPHGYCGVQISPPSENAILTIPPRPKSAKFTVPPRPWWERYQVVSYKLKTSSGDRAALRNMIQRCHRSGVRIYADVVINHMADHRWTGNGTGGSRGNGENAKYPAVPYNRTDFHWIRCFDFPETFYEIMKNYDCHLWCLKQYRPSVKSAVVRYLNDLLTLGVAGFRMDINKGLDPKYLQYIHNETEGLRTDMFGEGKRPFVYFEGVDDKEETDWLFRNSYPDRGRVMNYQYGRDLAKVFKGQISTGDLESWGKPFPWKMRPGHEKVVFIDNHNGQRTFKKWNPLLTYKQSEQHKLATAFMLAHPYGVPRVMSSYHFTNGHQGPPRDSADNIRHVNCTKGWVCEHRWREISNMVAFRNVANKSDVTNWWKGKGEEVGAFGFGRGNRAFIVFYMGKRIGSLIQTGLQSGIYCDVISGNLENGRCTGYTVRVMDDGCMNIYDIKERQSDQMMAIHIDSRIGPHNT